MKPINHKIHRHIRTQFIYKDVHKYIGLVCMTKPPKQSSDTVFIFLNLRLFTLEYHLGVQAPPLAFCS